MSSSQNQHTLGLVVDNEVELQTQPMDLAQKSFTTSSSGTPTSAPSRISSESSKPIFLVRGNPSPALNSSGLTIPANPISAHPPPPPPVIQQGLPVAVSVPITMTIGPRIQAIRPGTTVTLAPKAISTTLMTATGSFTGLPIASARGSGPHVPKGPAAVASITIPRSAVAAASVVRSGSAAGSTSAVPQVSGFPVTNRAIRPTLAAVQLTSLDSGNNTWVSVSPSTSSVSQSTVVAPASNPAVYKNSPVSVTVAGKSTPNITLTASGTKPSAGKVGGTSTTVVSVMGVGQQKPLTSSVTLSAIKGTFNTGAPRVSSNTAAGPIAHVGSDSFKPTSTVLQPVSLRAPSITITSTSGVQTAEKQYVKTLAGATVSTGQFHIATRTLNQPSSGVSIAPNAGSVPVRTEALTASAGNSAVTLSGSAKSIASLSNVSALGKVGQQSVTMQPPQMSVTAVTPKLGNASHSSLPAASRTGTVSLATVGGVVGSGRTYLVTTQAPTSTIIPVAKVLPQPIVGASSGSTTLKAVDLSTTTANQTSSESHSLLTSSGSVSSTLPSGLYVHPPRHATEGGYSFPATAILYDNGDRQTYQSQGSNIVQPAINMTTVTSESSSLYTSHTTQPNTPSKLGTSPRPSILRKRDYDGGQLKAQKNLTATLAMMASSSTSSGSTVAVVSTSSAISPPSPRRLEISLQSSAPNADSSRSSSGGSTTLSASSSPGIPPEMDENNPPLNMVSSSTSEIIGKAISKIQVKEESAETTEVSSVLALMRSGTSSGHLAGQVEMSPRKKPRKQQLLGQELQEVRSSDDEMHTVNIKELKSEPAMKSESKEIVAVLRRPRVSILSSYRQTWKARNHHFLRYSDVKLKDERRPTVTDLANQKHVMQKVHGWKVYHLSAQIEEMANLESQVYERLGMCLEAMERLAGGKSNDRDLMRVNELIKGNLQRSKVILDGLEDSKTQVLKIFEHKPRAEEIIHRYMFKRLTKKRDKS